MKNCEGTIGIHNRLLRGKGSFQLIEAPRGRPFLVRRRSSQERDWHFPQLLELYNFLGKSVESVEVHRSSLKSIGVLRNLLKYGEVREKSEYPLLM